MFSSPGSVAKALGKWVAAVVAGITAIAGAIAAVFALYPDLKVKESLGANIDRMAITQGVTIRTAARATRVEPNEPSALEGRLEEFDTNATGVVVMVHATLKGYQERHYNLKLEMVDPTTRERVQVLHTPGKLVGSCPGYSPDANEDGMVFTCWWTAPREGAEYKIRAVLMDAGANESSGTSPVQRPIDFIESDALVAVAPPG